MDNDTICTQYVQSSLNGPDQFDPSFLVTEAFHNVIDDGYMWRSRATNYFPFGEFCVESI